MSERKTETEKEKETETLKKERKLKGIFASVQVFSSEYGGKEHMDLVELYLPECFTYHSDTE